MLTEILHPPPLPRFVQDCRHLLEIGHVSFRTDLFSFAEHIRCFRLRTTATEFSLVMYIISMLYCTLAIVKGAFVVACTTFGKLTFLTLQTSWISNVRHTVDSDQDNNFVMNQLLV
jgi:hypothetical protein